MSLQAVFEHGRQLYARDLELIGRVVAAVGDEGLSSVAAELCRLWSWRSWDGRLCIEPCKELLRILEEESEVEIPCARRRRRRRGRVGQASPPRPLDTAPVSGTVSALAPLRLRVVDGVADTELWSHLIERYHYLGARVVIGNHLKYLAFIGDRPVAALLWGRAALKLAARDRFIGWSLAERRAGLDRVANNYRFLVLPWVRVRFLASHLLGMNVRRISGDWHESFGHGLDWLETFVDPERFQATCYRAANWIPVGMTQGSGRRGPAYHYHGKRKLILLYPVHRRDRRRRPRAPPHPRSSLYARPLPGSATPPDVEPGTLSTTGGGVMAIQSAAFSIAKPICELQPADIEPAAELLVDYHKSFRDVFGRREQSEHARTYTIGLLSKIHRRNVEQLALYGGEPVAVRTLQSYLTDSPWSDEAVRIRHQLHVADSMGQPEGVLIIDGSGFPKKGKESAGVARQYCGATGKIDNCQVGVFLAYWSEHGAAILDGRLYMPQSWFTQEQKERRWKRCRIPNDLEFKTKPQLATEMLCAVAERGQLPGRWVLADEEFGRDTTFLDHIPDAYWYFCEVPKNTQVWTSRPHTEEVKGKRGRPASLRIKPGEPSPQKVGKLVEHPNLSWQHQTLKEGAKGPITAEVARMRVIEVRHGLPGTEVWLFLRRSPTTGEVKYYLSNAPVDTPLDGMIRAAAARWPIETCFQESKDRLGMDQYEVRSWTGWHHHMTLVMLAHYFLHHLRLTLKKKVQD